MRAGALLGYLNGPEVGVKLLAFLGSHGRVVERRRHRLRHALVSELHPTFSEVAPPQPRPPLPPPHLLVWGGHGHARGR